MTLIPVAQVLSRLSESLPISPAGETEMADLFQKTWQSLSDEDVITLETPADSPVPQPPDDMPEEQEVTLPILHVAPENVKKQSLTLPDTLFQVAEGPLGMSAAQGRLPSRPLPVSETALSFQNDPLLVQGPIAPHIPTENGSPPSAPLVKSAAVPLPVMPFPLPSDSPDAEQVRIDPPPVIPNATAMAPNVPDPSVLPLLATAPAAFRLLPLEDRDPALAAPSVPLDLTHGQGAAPAQAPPIHRAQPALIAQQLAVALAASDTGTTEVTLNPEELGRVRLSLTPSDTGITVSILAERPDTADLMRRHLDTLTREFQAIGYDDVTFDFSGDGSAAPDQQTQDGAPLDQPADSDPVPPIPAEIAMLSLASLDLKL